MTQHATLSLSEKHIQLIVWTLLLLTPIIGMVVDLVAPSLPAIAASLNVSAQITKNVISIYLLGFALGNFITGFLSDAFGRRNLIRMGLLGFVIVSLIPVFSSNIEVVLLARFLQGITIGSVSVLARAILSDVLPPEKLVRMGVLIGAMWGIGPVIGPAIGGYLQYYFGWRAGFCFFALISFLAFFATFFIVPETHFNRHPLNIVTIKNNLREVLSHKIFMAMVFLMGLSYSLIVIFNTVGPFLVQEKLQYSPVFFGHLALWLGLAYLFSTFGCRFILKSFRFEPLLFIFINAFFLISFAGVGLSYFFSSSIVLIALMSALMYSASGIIFSMAMGKGLSLFRHIAGTASATMFFVNILITSVMGFLVGFVNVETNISLMWMYFILMFLSMLVYWARLRVASS